MNETPTCKRCGCEAPAGFHLKHLMVPSREVQALCEGCAGVVEVEGGVRLPEVPETWEAIALADAADEAYRHYKLGATSPNKNLPQAMANLAKVLRRIGRRTDAREVFEGSNA